MAHPQARTMFSDELLAVGRALGPVQPKEVVTDIILRPAISSLGAVAGAVLLINARRDQLKLITRQGYAEDAVTIWQDGPLDRSLPATDAIRRQEPLFFGNSDDLKRLYPQLEEETGAVGPVASAVLPILLDGQALGVLVLDFQEPHVFTPAEQQFLVTLALQCAAALDRSVQHARVVSQQQAQVDILESISDAFYAVDEAWRLTYVNRRAEAFWGRRREDLLGKVYWTEFPQAVGSEPYHAHLRAARERQVVRLEAQSPITGFWITITINPTAQGLSVYFADITERKALEAKANEATRTLERRVLERTRDLQDLNAELRAYAIGISRDLTEPLRRVNAFVGLLEGRLKSQVDDRTRRLFKQVREETRRVGDRMDELRHLAALERRELREEPLDLFQLAVQVRSDLEPLVRGRKVAWSVGPLPRVLGDPLLLRLVFTELFAVALDATQDQADARIGVGGEVRGEEVVAWVEHNGRGLTHAQATRIFDVFQVPPAVAGAEERIGLSNVRRIVARHGGQVSASSDGQTGARLLIALPDRLGARGPV
ncbi:GAF domain-containing protein (plasmid) [Deinococcus taeanensis]|uniref:sensor histidine kinase n=1 Tax=Deinococcus taeanensis TaxID=2737050 RepID=UPI001CDC6BA2|nr:GAF domain-containing protein [Deinococcus taeanensis]UBV44199.1 GAF domain-containing protein [Deinococcus taeanensis]